MAEAIRNHKAKGRLVAESAGSQPTARVPPLAIAMLGEYDIPWAGHPPRGVGGLEREPWDLVITVCDRARESCPVFPGQPILAHWGMPDPAAVPGDEATQRAAFKDAPGGLRRRRELARTLPLAKVERPALWVRAAA